MIQKGSVAEAGREQNPAPIIILSHRCYKRVIFSGLLLALLLVIIRADFELRDFFVLVEVYVQQYACSSGAAGSVVEDVAFVCTTQR